MRIGFKNIICPVMNGLITASWYYLTTNNKERISFKNIICFKEHCMQKKSKYEHDIVYCRIRTESLIC